MESENRTDAELDPPKEFDKAMRGIAGTPKGEVDKAEEKERRKKDADGQK